ncbi:MAG TPA: protease pro-enzyme activation domain-containing protein, partial [Candidatus Baltobacteraceae bacterium]|nr:protease pro-enzyme activation domain-containing protein [Candidatus Baltobacteraceae bacterium]
MTPPTKDGRTVAASSNAMLASNVRENSRESLTPLSSVPRTYGKLAFTDLGRRNAHAPVSVTLTLRYNHQADLDRFVANIGRTHHVLTPAQFIERYAPTRQQEQRVVRALRAAGFTITQRFANRTIVDATAPTGVVERFFSTQIHTVRQGAYGLRFTNVRPG